jgi:hypothetical protein
MKHPAGGTPAGCFFAPPARCRRAPAGRRFFYQPCHRINNLSTLSQKCHAKDQLKTTGLQVACCTEMAAARPAGQHFSCRNCSFSVKKPEL